MRMSTFVTFALTLFPVAAAAAPDDAEVIELIDATFAGRIFYGEDGTQEFSQGVISGAYRHYEVKVTLPSGETQRFLDTVSPSADGVFIVESAIGSDGPGAPFRLRATVTADGKLAITPVDPSSTAFVSRVCEHEARAVTCLKTVRNGDGSVSVTTYSTLAPTRDVP